MKRQVAKSEIPQSERAATALREGEVINCAYVEREIISDTRNRKCSAVKSGFRQIWSLWRKKPFPLF